MCFDTGIDGERTWTIIRATLVNSSVFNQPTRGFVDDFLSLTSEDKYNLGKSVASHRAKSPAFTFQQLYSGQR